MRSGGSRDSKKPRGDNVDGEADRLIGFNSLGSNESIEVVERAESGINAGPPFRVNHGIGNLVELDGGELLAHSPDFANIGEF
jgi:hypothetical protein